MNAFCFLRRKAPANTQTATNRSSPIPVPVSAGDSPQSQSVEPSSNTCFPSRSLWSPAATPKMAAIFSLKSSTVSEGSQCRKIVCRCLLTRTYIEGDIVCVWISLPRYHLASGWMGETSLSAEEMKEGVGWGGRERSGVCLLLAPFRRFFLAPVRSFFPFFVFLSCFFFLQCPSPPPPLFVAVVLVLVALYICLVFPFFSSAAFVHSGCVWLHSISRVARVSTMLLSLLHAAVFSPL